MALAVIGKRVERAKANDYDALLLGGLMNPDKLRMNKQAVQFVRDFFEQKKPVASICHGPWTLVEAGVVQGRKVMWMSLSHNPQSSKEERQERWRRFC
ncbi:MAG: DJ-1/PfpI family protein [Caldilineaceae bacterium]|nr:DJ-1/PfpI family protein [Caldilineaceae bacterium]